MKIFNGAEKLGIFLGYLYGDPSNLFATICSGN